MSAILNSARAGFSTAAQRNPAFLPGLEEITTARTAWSDGMTAIRNAEADRLSKTMAMEAKLATLTHKPDIETASLLDKWDLAIRTIAPQGSSLYIQLLPHGRETLTKGSSLQRTLALDYFSTRLSKQTDRPTLIALSDTSVKPFAASTTALRDAHALTKAKVRQLRGAQEQLRKDAAADLFSAVALGMRICKKTPHRVDELFNVHLLRRVPKKIPAGSPDNG